MEESRRRHVHLYSEELTGFCKDNKLYLDLLKDHVEELKKLKQYDQILKKSKTENEIHRQSKAADSRNLAVMFTPVSHGGNDFFKAQARPGEYEDLMTSHQHTSADNPFCYLCRTLEQHKSHMPKTERRIHGKKRPLYEAPLPFVPPKPLPPEPESKECLFKVTVKTGTDIEAACAVPVFISLQGEEGKLRKARLAKKFGSLGFFFDSGSTEVFHLRGPHIGRLERLTLTMDDGAESESAPSDVASKPGHRRRWLVESVSVKDYSLGLEYHFSMDRWLRPGVSKRSGNRRDQVRAAPTSTARCAVRSGRGVLVTTYTGPKATAGTDCPVFISLMGPDGAKGRHELRQPPEAARVFQPGGKDVFELYVADFGDLKGIRLELDIDNVRPPEDSGGKKKFDRGRPTVVAKTWFVDQVIVKDIKSGKKWLFTISDWLNEDHPLKEFWTVKDVEDQMGPVYNKKTLYEIVTKTGKKDFAGTDSTIFLSLFDNANRQCDIELKDKDKSRFERGKTDTIMETARAIGTPERLKVAISGTGVAPDWFVDGIVVTKYLVAEEILQFMQRLQSTNKMPDGLAKDKGKILFEAPDGKQRKRQRSADSTGGKSKTKRDDRAKKDKKTSGSSSRDFADGDIFGGGRTAKGRPGLTHRKGSEDSDNTDDDTDRSAREDKESSSDADSVKSHDDFDPEHGLVRLPYAVRVAFTPRTEDEAWLKKNKAVELRASDSGKLLFKELRVRSDNANFSTAKKPPLVTGRRRVSSSDSDTSANTFGRPTLSAKGPGNSSTVGKPSVKAKVGEDDRKQPSRASTSKEAGSVRGGAKKPPLVTGRRRVSSSDSDSSSNTFGRPTLSTKGPGNSSTVGKPSVKAKVGEDDRKQPSRASTSKEADSVRGGALTSSALRSSAARSPRSGQERNHPPAASRGLDHVDYGRDRDKGSRSRDGLDLSKDRNKVGLEKGNERKPLVAERGHDFDRDQARSSRDLDRDRDRLDFDRSQDRSALDLDKGRGRLGDDKGLDRSPLDLDRGRGRSDFAKDGKRSPQDLDRGRGRLDFDKGQDRSPLDLDRGRGRLDRDEGQDRSPLDLDRGRGRLDLDKGQGRSPRDFDKVRRGPDSTGQDRSPLDLDKGRSRLDLEKGQDRSPRDLEKGQGRSPLDLDRGRSRLDFDKGLDRSPLDLDKGRGGRLDFDRSQDKSPLDLDRGRGGRLDSDKGQSRGPRDLDRSRGGRLDYDKPQNQSPLDLDRSRGRLDLDKGRGRLDLDKDQDRNPRDLDRGIGRLDLDRGRARAGPAPLDNPRILVTATDGRTGDPVSARGAGRVRQHSFNLD